MRVVERGGDRVREVGVDHSLGDVHPHLEGLAEVAKVGGPDEVVVGAREALGVERLAGPAGQFAESLFHRGVFEPVVFADCGLNVVVPDIDGQQPERRDVAGVLRHDDSGQVEDVDQSTGQQGTGAAERGQHEVPDVQATLDRDLAQRVGLVPGRDLQDPGGARIGAESEPAGDVLYAGASRGRIQRDLPAQQVRRNTAEHEVCVGDRGLETPCAITDRTWVGSGRPGADLEGPFTGDPGDGPAAGTHRHHIDHRDLGRVGPDRPLGGEPTLTTEGTVGPYPSKIPMIDVVTVGAGGGSIAWISREGTLKVGPRSARADPGPICYGTGGFEPTITDAHLMLGRIPPHLLGGEIPLDPAAARAGIEDIAGRLRLSPDACAAGILEISAWNQANALRQISVKRGLDVRDFMLATFGGSGSLLACRLVDILDLAGVVVAQNPGNVSAFGLLTVDVRNDYVQTAVCKHDRLEFASVEKTFGELTGRAGEALDAEGFARADHHFIRTADLRYFGQAFEVRVNVPEGVVDADFADTVATTFHDAHRALYGYDFRDDARQQVEWVNLRVTGIGPIARPVLTEIGTAEDSANVSAERAHTGTRGVCFDPADGYVDTGIYWRPDLRAGDELRGPVIIEEYGSTAPIHPGFTVCVDTYGNLVITKESAK